jgi:hypothetical protein
MGKILFIFICGWSHLGEYGRVADAETQAQTTPEKCSGECHVFRINKKGKNDNVEMFLT